jgi:hypothetical protein
MNYRNSGGGPRRVAPTVIGLEGRCTAEKIFGRCRVPCQQLAGKSKSRLGSGQRNPFRGTAGNWVGRINHAHHAVNSASGPVKKREWLLRAGRNSGGER